jgi:hypothetical protein
VQGVRSRKNALFVNANAVQQDTERKAQQSGCSGGWGGILAKGSQIHIMNLQEKGNGLP